VFVTRTVRRRVAGGVRAATEGDVVSEVGHSEEPTAPAASAAHVLVVEDDGPLRESLCHFIEREGYSAQGAGDGETGLDAMERHLPDIIVLDLLLGRMDGFAFMERLAERYGRGRPKVIVLSGTERLDLARVRLGAEAYISKPFDVDRLRAALSRLAVTARRPAR
jgi:two-component system response regulator MprA